MEQTLKLEKLNESDYEPDEFGAKTVTWDGLDKRMRNLYKLQEVHRPILKQFLNYLGYEIVKEWRESDGWGDGFKIDHFQVKDRRGGSEKHLTGSDDNTSIYEDYSGKGGGKGLWKSVPNTTAWYKAEKGK